MVEMAVVGAANPAKAKQRVIVREIVKGAGVQGIRTEQVKIQAMYQGVSCADRYLRWLKQDGVILCEREQGDKTKTWRATSL